MDLILSFELVDYCEGVTREDRGGRGAWMVADGGLLLEVSAVFFDHRGYDLY